MEGDNQSILVPQTINQSIKNGVIEWWNNDDLPGTIYEPCSIQLMVPLVVDLGHDKDADVAPLYGLYLPKYENKETYKKYLKFRYYDKKSLRS